MRFMDWDQDVGSPDLNRGTHKRDLSAAFDAGNGHNPDWLLVPVARLGGITRAIATPAYDDAPGRELLFAGQAAAVALAGRPMLMRRGVAMVLEMGEGGAEQIGRESWRERVCQYV